ncbi:MAG TPA: hypothetical protein VN706_12420 [Gemmatimonadaceae bacterium]|nr:hypothetical protein [Gemmatimonadaceae bacterium]
MTSPAATKIELPKLSEWLAQRIVDAEPSRVAVLAGHYALFSAGGKTMDFLDASSFPEGVPADLMAFTKFTWYAACQALASACSPRTQLVASVDDVQFVRPAVEDRHLREQLAVALVEQYYQAVPELPHFHHVLLSQAGLDADDVLPCMENRWLFSERWLRQRSVGHLREHAMNGRHGLAHLHSDETLSRISVRDPELGEFCMIESGNGNCASGYFELITELRMRGVELLIAMIPMRCLAQITAATVLAERLGVANGFRVVNVSLADVEAELPAQVSGVLI